MSETVERRQSHEELALEIFTKYVESYIILSRVKLELDSSPVILHIILNFIDVFVFIVLNTTCTVM